MATLVLAEHDAAGLDPATARVVTMARALGRPIDILVAGVGCAEAAAQAARIAGVRRVLLVDDPATAHRLAEPMAALLAGLAGAYDALLSTAGSTGRNIMPRVAALLDVMQVSEIVRVEAPDTFVRPIYAGNALEIVRTRDARLVATVRANAFEPAGTAEPVPVEAVAGPVDPGTSRYLGDSREQSDRPDLGAARVVVAGGRAFGSKTDFERLLAPLAGVLGAAIGASRVAVDSGYAPNELQVGQTGRIVAPQLYIACGISGAVQHLAGMKESRCIVAINKDPEAPIFAIADYGLVGDVFEVLPELTTRLND